MVVLEAGSDEWLAHVKEDIIDPERLIIDPHHHLWKKRFGRNYLLPELWSDTGSGRRNRVHYRLLQAERIKPL